MFCHAPVGLDRRANTTPTGGSLGLAFVALTDIGDQILRESSLHVIGGLPGPVVLGGSVIEVCGPAIHDALSLDVGRKGDICVREVAEHLPAELLGR